MMKKVVVSAVLMLFVASIVFPGCSYFKGETTSEYFEDSTITTEVNGAILEDKEAQYFKIDVTTTQGDVVLTGFVNSRETESRLVTKIKTIKGVKSVKSLLKIEKKEKK